MYFLCTTWNFHVVVVQWRQRNVQKSVMHVQNCCFLVIKPIGFVAFPLPSPSSDLKVPNTELLKQQLRRRLQKRHLNWGKVALLQTWSRLFHLVQFVKFWQFFLELNLKRLYRSSGKGKENRCLAAFLFLSRLKLGMSCSDGKDRNVQKKKGDARAKLLFCQS